VKIISKAEHFLHIKIIFILYKILSSLFPHTKKNQSKSLKEPCPGCEAPYGYTNVMRLSTDTSRFSVSRKIQQTKQRNCGLIR
jgi:hypothetical protein